MALLNRFRVGQLSNISAETLFATKQTRLTVMITLVLIWCAEFAYFPMSLSIVFLIMLLVLAWNHYKISSSLSIELNQQSKLQKAIKLSLTFIALVAIWLNYRTFVGVEAGTAALSTFLYAKALETRKLRDYIVLFNFTLFVSASLFLHSQAVWMALIVLSCLVGCLVGLYQLQIGQYIRSGEVKSSLKTDILHVSKVLGLAVPFFVLLFIFFPRLPPLWQIPVSSQQGVTGMSDRMSPGDIAELSQSSALAFRLTGDIHNFPSRAELYWRAMVLDLYDGQTWTSHPKNQMVQNISPLKSEKPILNYQYIAADYRVHWIMGLESSIPNQNGFILNVDGAITPRRAVQQVQPIQLQWIGSAPLSIFSQNQIKQETQFQSALDLQSQRLARQLWDQSNHQPEQYVKHVLNWYKQNSFSYTLTPGILGKNRIDEFLFRTRQGFCEHYASSFAMLMRYVGIPSRIVVGYQGGQLAPDGKSWEVRQMDAHAWTEVQFNGKWNRIDPTFIVAPERIDRGMQDYMQSDQSLFGDNDGSTWKYQQFNALRTLRVWSDYASYQWQSKVVGYNAEKQSHWMSKLGLNSSYSFALLLVLGLVVLGLIYFIGVRSLKFFSSSRLERIILHFSKSVDVEFQKNSFETFGQWMQRLSESTESKVVFQQASSIFQMLAYTDKEDKVLLKQLDVLLKQCAFELKSYKKTCHEFKK